MDAKRLGSFIAERRKELGLTQVVLAEKLLVDTIQLSKTTSRIVKCSGSIIIWGFISISVVLLLLLISDGKIVLFSVGSLIAGFGFALISLAIQFLNIAYKIHMNDWAAVEDTIDALVIIVFIFILGTLGLNIMMIRFSKYKRG